MALPVMIQVYLVLQQLGKYYHEVSCGQNKPAAALHCLVDGSDPEKCRQQSPKSLLHLLSFQLHQQRLPAIGK